MCYFKFKFILKRLEVIQTSFNTFLGLKLIHISYKDSVLTSQETESTFIRKTNLLNLFRKKQSYETLGKNRLCGMNGEFVSSKPGGM